MALRACVIDDMPLVAAALELTLTDAGFSVAVAHDWAGAARLMSAQTFDVIISDLQLPGLTDAEIIGLIRAHAPLTPIIALSGWDHRFAATIARANGADGFVAKPARRAMLLAAIDQAVRGRTTALASR